jgi:hypothetical protein
MDGLSGQRSGERGKKGDAVWSAGDKRRPLRRLSAATGSGRAKSEGKPVTPPKHVGPWFIYYFQRHPDDDASSPVPGRVFLSACPGKVQAMMKAVLVSVAAAPPPAFSGGGKWEAMHDDMSGIFEVRVDGAGRHHFRLFCVLERDGASLGLGGPSIVVITGKDKPFLTKLSAEDYRQVRTLRDEYLTRSPRSVER